MTISELADHLPTEFDFTLVTLKGHLLVEATLDDYLYLQLEKPSALLDKTRLQFDLKVKLAHALAGDTPGLDIWPALDNLNKIRNSLAHRLTDERLANLRKEFVRQVFALKFAPEPGRDDDRIYTGAIAYLIGVVQGLSDPYDS